MKGFRLLEPDEIECRVQRCTEKGVSILLYKTARTDADLLDETVGEDKWSNDFKVIDGVLYGGIGVDYGHGVVWKWDAGSESNMEAEKGRASDAFKRAGFKHGIGRELYSAPFIWVPAGKCKKLKDVGGRWTCNDNFEVQAISYDDDEHIKGLVITSGGDVVFQWGDTGTGALYCDDCGGLIVDGKKRDGSPWPASEIAAYTKSFSGKCLCFACGKKYREAQT